MADLTGGSEDSLGGTEGPGDRVDEEWTKPGSMLGERFVVERKLGSGGMGYVVLARHLELGELVAIKLLLPARAMREEARNRLTREARAAARIKSSHVVRVFDVVSKGPGAPYVVMEYLTGETLKELLTRTGQLPIDRAADIVIQTCEALAEAHRNGTIHRDLKPSNLFLTAGRRSFVKVLDFGIAKTTEADSSSLTQSQALLASPAYASPEQLRASKHVDERSDLWSLGVILYESVTGRAPFDGRTLPELSSEILRDSPRPPSAHRSDLPQELEQVILRCLEKDPADRFESVESLVMALEPFAPSAAKECLAYVRDLGETTTASPTSRDESMSGASHHRSTLTHASVAGPAEHARPRWMNRLVLTSVTAAALLALAIAILRDRPEPATAASPAESITRSAAAIAPPVPSVVREHPKPGPEPLVSGSVASEPPTALSAARPQNRSEPVRARPPSPIPSALTKVEQAEPGSLESEPGSLESLPLDALIDGRK